MAIAYNRSVSLTKEDIEYLESHPEINFSGMVQKMMKELREKEEVH
jgi:hypothetical protein